MQGRRDQPEMQPYLRIRDKINNSGRGTNKLLTRGEEDWLQNGIQTARWCLPDSSTPGTNTTMQ